MRSSYIAHEVFTPSTQAQVNFVDRTSVNSQLMDALYTSGKQLIVYGESGCGKSTLLMNKLRAASIPYITTRCSQAMTYQQLLLGAFDQLNPFYTQNRGIKSSRNISPSLQAAFIKVSAGLSKAEDEQENRALPLQLTAQRLAEFLGAQSMCWVVEDFHKMPSEEKVPFAQSLKIFSDVSTEYPDVMVIAIGATDTAREVIQYDPEMSNRVSELRVPTMTSEELGRIIENGQELLNINLSAVADSIVGYSLGMPSTCHQIALYTCLEQGVTSTQKVRLVLNRRDLYPAVKRWINDSSDTIQAKLFRALGRRVVGKYDNCKIILAAIASGPLTGMAFDDILARIRLDTHDYPEKNLRRYLRELTKDERGQLLRAVDGGKWRFTSAIYHSIVHVMLSKPRTGAKLTSRQYVEQAVARSWADAVYSVPSLANTVFSDSTGTYYLDIKGYLGSNLVSYGSTAGSGIGSFPEVKNLTLYEAPVRRPRKRG